MAEPAGYLNVAQQAAESLQQGEPVVALESTVIAHGLPWPVNLQTARELEAAVRAEGATPATIAVLDGKVRIGLTDAELERLARGGATKAGRRDLAAVLVQRRDAGTTVSATIFLAQQAGIRVVATGGIGGVHRGAMSSFDISADLIELARTPVCVVCSGAKSILDIPATLEFLETHGVPVIGYRTERFPAFHMRNSGPPLEQRCDEPAQLAELLRCHWSLGGAGVVVAQQCPEEHALPAAEFEDDLRQAEADLAAQQIHGKEVTPFLLARLADITGGATIQANRQLLLANAQLAARLAGQLRNMR